MSTKELEGASDETPSIDCGAIGPAANQAAYAVKVE